MAVAKYVLLVVGFGLLITGMVGGLTSAYHFQVNCNAGLYKSVVYQGAVTNSATGLAIPNAGVFIYDLTQRNISQAGTTTNANGFYSVLLLASSGPMGSDYGCDQIGIAFYGPPGSAYTSGWDTFQLPDTTGGNSVTMVTNFQLAPLSTLTAAFGWSASSLLVQFTDKSSGTPTSWSWAFGDGYTSGQQNPAHSYGASGNYTVQLTVTRPAPSATSTATSVVKVVSQASGSGATSPPPPAPPTGPIPGMTPPGGNVTNTVTLQKQLAPFIPSVLDILLVVIGFVLVVAAAAWKG